MAQKRRKFTRELKLQVVREGKSVKPVAQAAREHEIHLTHIIKWRQLHQQHAEQAFGAMGTPIGTEARTAELERIVGQLTMVNALLKKPCCGSKGAERRSAERLYALDLGSRWCMKSVSGTRTLSLEVELLRKLYEFGYGEKDCAVYNYWGRQASSTG